MIGKQLRGRQGNSFRIVRELGRGGFGVVYLVENDAGAHHAMKLIRGVQDPLLRASFTQEVESARGLMHPGIMGIMDYGECKLGDGEVGLFTVMEYCPDGDYRAVVSHYASKTSPVEDIILDIRQILEALEVLHTRIIHRDLKPENILVKGSQLKLTDFGLAKFVDEATRTLTFKGAGTPRYMAPEVWLRGRMSPATDLYAVGVILFEALAGEPPFSEGNVDELKEKHLYEPAPRVKSRNAGVPAIVDGVIKKLLEKEAQNRYQTALEVLDALSRGPRSTDAEVAEIATRARQHHDHEETARLERQQGMHREAEERAKEAYKERELVDLLDEVVAEVNEHLVETKIVPADQAGERAYRFDARSLHVHFFRSGELYENPSVPGRMKYLRDRRTVHGHCCPRTPAPEI